MRYRDSTHEETELLRAQLRNLVEDVEPSGDALPRLLSAARRRSVPRCRVLVLAGATVAVAVAFLVVLVATPGAPPQPAPASVAPNSYLAQPRPGVIASFDVASGRQIRQFAHLSGGPAEAIVADGDRVYTAVSRGPAKAIVEVLSNGAQRDVVPELDPRQPVLMAAGGGLLAYVDYDAVVLTGGPSKHRIPVPPGTRVTGLALGHDGRLAVLTDSAGKATINLADATTPTLTQRKPIRLVGGCGSVAIAWSGSDIAALSPTSCEAASTVRIARFNPDSGEQIAAGAPFNTGGVDGVRLSSDRLGRFLVSQPDARQWVVDGSDVRPIPPACAPDGSCARQPATFWG